jgi:nucleoside-diphosphate-sugar epimerase
MIAQQENTDNNRTVIVAGAHGVAGRAALEHYATLPGTGVYGLSRRSAPRSGKIHHISVDLLNPDDIRAKLGHLSAATHLVFGAYIEKPTAAEKTAVNVEILRNLLDVLEKTAPALKHITLYQGGKAYGADLGPFKTPAREDDPRLMPPNFYYDQEDLLRARQRGKNWHFTVLRPEAISGFALGNPMNLTMVIAVYAAISKELGLPLRFPGTIKAYQALYQITSAEILARATAWAGVSQAAQNEIFNITNGDYFRWQYMWPRIAKMFEMAVADPIPISLTEYMADKGQVWDAIVKKHDLQPIPYEQIVAWPFGDFIFHTEFDNITSTIKARRAGFHDCIDTEDMFSEFFQKLRAMNVLPQLHVEGSEATHKE